MKVAVAIDGPHVAPHFGRCQAYLLADVVDGVVGQTQEIESPGHEPGRLPAMLKEFEVECVIAGGMGPRAVGLFEQYGINTIAGVSGLAADALELFSKGELVSGDSTCHH